MLGIKEHVEWGRSDLIHLGTERMKESKKSQLLRLAVLSLQAGHS